MKPFALDAIARAQAEATVRFAHPDGHWIEIGPWGREWLVMRCGKLEEHGAHIVMSRVPSILAATPTREAAYAALRLLMLPS